MLEGGGDQGERELPAPVITVSAMGLTQGLVSPRTPLRRFLDRELSAGVRRVRATYRSRLPTRPLSLPGPGVGYEAGAIGTAIDQRLRLAFTCSAPVDAATLLGVEGCIATAERNEDDVVRALAKTGRHLMAELAAAVQAMRLDDRREPMLRADQDEEHLARLLLAAAWYAVNLRNPFAFGDTPLCKAAYARPEGLDLAALLAVPHRDLVEDLLAQLHRAENGPLEDLRAATAPDRSPAPWPAPGGRGCTARRSAPPAPRRCAATGGCKPARRRGW
jgi:phosphohistidine phosphatase SixA